MSTGSSTESCVGQSTKEKRVLLRAIYKAAKQCAIDQQADADQCKPAIAQMNGHRVRTSHVHAAKV